MAKTISSQLPNAPAASWATSASATAFSAPHSARRLTCSEQTASAAQFAGSQEFQPSEWDAWTIPVSSPGQRHQADETFTGVEERQTKLPPILRAVDAPPRQQPVRRLHDFLAHATCQQVGPCRTQTFDCCRINKDAAGKPRRRGGWPMCGGNEVHDLLPSIPSAWLILSRESAATRWHPESMRGCSASLRGVSSINPARRLSA